MGNARGDASVGAGHRAPIPQGARTPDIRATGRSPSVGRSPYFYAWQRIAIEEAAAETAAVDMAVSFCDDRDVGDLDSDHEQGMRKRPADGVRAGASVECGRDFPPGAVTSEPPCGKAPDARAAGLPLQQAGRLVLPRRRPAFSAP